MNKNLIGICGLFCGACDNYIAFSSEGKHLLETEKFKNQNLEKLKCSGCNSDSLSEHCSKCEIMKCAKSKSFVYCGQCKDFPCSLINNFISGGIGISGAKHRMDIVKNTKAIQQNGLANWLTENQNRWTCKCGQHYTYYEDYCIICGEKLCSYSE